MLLKPAKTAVKFLLNHLTKPGEWMMMRLDSAQALK